MGMKAVLLSPVVVLVIWSVFLVTSKPMTSNARSAVRVPVRPKSSSREGGLVDVHQNAGFIVPLNAINNNVVANSMSGNTDSLVVARPHPHPREEGPVVYLQPPAYGSGFPAISSFMGMTRSQTLQGQPLQSETMFGEGNMMMQAQPMQQEAMQGQSLLVQPPIQAQAAQGQNIIVQPPNLQAQSLQGQTYMMQAQPMDTETLQGQNNMVQAQPSMGRSQPAVQPGVSVRYYYYDPAHTKQDASGNLILPDTVYDSQGRAVPLALLQQDAVLQQDPPRGVFHHDNFTNDSSIPRINITYSHPNTVQTRKERKKQATFAAGDIPTVGTDQSIIVGTAGIMALLVGALSARRLRSKGILSLCMDDENLQDDAAYDTAFTTSGSYNTFAWKGDLEKFDV
ncbi:hypothetical protein FisN_10Lh119 [Fistulifera solaris]|uniref:Uncharacterized protein n=1 Tax=Fistulifera solaris TaxID=1519565 RepID=A0A1Z5JU25_FISSO|nr:hypothetical protein FisN_10Lh119 [Fistulifera solaris]|eukprot:GAX17261.1 hypothetical protein FisN_10Lh119 [Fistulifera solaris]